MAYPWRTNAKMGFGSVPVLRKMWTPEFTRQYWHDLRLTSIQNNLYRMKNVPRTLDQKAR